MGTATAEKKAKIIHLKDYIKIGEFPLMDKSKIKTQVLHREEISPHYAVHIWDENPRHWGGRILWDTAEQAYNSKDEIDRAMDDPTLLYLRLSEGLKTEF